MYVKNLEYSLTYSKHSINIGDNDNDSDDDMVVVRMVRMLLSPFWLK